MVVGKKGEREKDLQSLKEQLLYSKPNMRFSLRTISFLTILKLFPLSSFRNCLSKRFFAFRRVSLR